MKPTSLIALLIGSGIGVGAAIASRYASPEADPPALTPGAARALEPVRSAAVAAPEGVTRQPEVPEAVAGEPLAGAVPPIASKEELEAAAVACEAKDAGACRRAATAAELGEGVPKDPERAKRFRKIELTLLVRSCEKNAVLSCLTLADRYLRGDGVEQNDRTATALIEHAKEICSRKPDEACRSIPRN